MRRVIIGLVFFLAALNSSFGQGSCGTTVTDEQIEIMNSWQTASKRVENQMSNVLVTIPLTIYVIRRDDGTGGLTESLVNQAVQTTNNYYENSNMRFIVSGGVKFIDSSEFFDLTSAEEGKLALTNDVSGTVNVYFSNTLSSNGTPLCGYTRFPPSEDRVFVANACVFGGTFEHELGHYFTLYHTHGKTNTGTTDELVDGSNCTSAGDDICDTPADPNLSGRVASNCQYTGIVKDANDQFYVPNPRNIMAYSLDQCQDYFSPGQYERIRNGFENGRSYLNFTSEQFSVFFTAGVTSGCPGTSVEFKSTSFGATRYEWEFPGGTPSTATGSKPKVVYNTGGEFDVRVTAFNSSGSEARVSRSKFIKINDPLEFAIQEDLIEIFESNSLPEGWLSKAANGGLPFGIASINFPFEGPTSNSLYMNNFGNDGVFKSESSIDLPSFDMSGIRGFDISFDYAYTFRPETSNGTTLFEPRYDTLSLNLVTTCSGLEESVWRKGGGNLATAEQRLEEFIPEQADWKHISLNKTFTSERDFAKFSFEVISGNGNNLYIDNISILPDYELNAPTFFRITENNPGSLKFQWTDRSINELGFIIQRKVGLGDFVNIDTVSTNVTTFIDFVNPNGVSYTYRVVAMGFNDNVSNGSNEVVYVVSGLQSEKSLKFWPNPTEGTLSILSNVSGDFSIMDLLGRTVLASKITRNSLVELKLNTLSEGIYFIKVKDFEGHVELDRFIIERK